MLSKQRSIDPKLSFLAGWLLGRRRRRASGFGCLVLMVALLAGMTAVTSLINAPVAWNSSRQTARLPRPNPAELVKMAPGTQVLAMARIPDDMAVDAHGLALFQTEVYTGQDNNNSDERQASGWRKENPVPARFGMLLLDDSMLLVQFTAEVDLLNAQMVESESAEPRMRAVGYLPGQTVTLHGIWEGENLFTADKLYAGSVDDYLKHQARMPGFSLLMAFLCGGMAVLLLALAGLLRILGR